jgi:hypothetical protein
MGAMRERMLRGQLYIGSDAASAAGFGRAQLAEFNGAPPGAWAERRVARVQLLTATHPIDPETRRIGWESAEPIAIADNVWLGDEDRVEVPASPRTE